MALDHAAAAFVIQREFNAPLTKTWKAWSEAEALRQWWGPQGCTVGIEHFEFQAGGLVHYSMTFPGAPAMWGRFHYREIVPMTKLVWLNAFANEHGGIARAPFSEVCPLEVENTVAFEVRGDTTVVTLRAIPFGALNAERAYFTDLKPSLEIGYGSTLAQLGHYLQRP